MEPKTLGSEVPDSTWLAPPQTPATSAEGQRLNLVSDSQQPLDPALINESAIQERAQSKDQILKVEKKLKQQPVTCSLRAHIWARLHRDQRMGLTVLLPTWVKAAEETSSGIKPLCSRNPCGR